MIEAIAIALILLAMGVDQPESVRLFHATRNLNHILKKGFTGPSTRQEIIPDFDAARLRFYDMSEMTWEEKCLIPMFGRSYGWLELGRAKKYLGFVKVFQDGRWIDGPISMVGSGIVEVKPRKPWTLCPDEDWIGEVLLGTGFSMWHGEVLGPVVRNRSSGYDNWTCCLIKALSNSSIKEIERGLYWARDRIADGCVFDDVCFHAIVGKMAIRDLERTDEGRRILLEGLRYTLQFSVEGTLDVVRVVESAPPYGTPFD
jgi:hypothetical protein